MKKTIFTSIIALAAVFSFSAAAQQTDNTTCAPTEQCAKQSKEKKSLKEGHKKGQRTSAFEGIALTDNQKAAIEALRPQRPQRGERPQKSDSTAERPNPRKMRSDYVAAVKQILTPEQYVVFLENVVINDASLPGQRRMDSAPMHRTDHKAPHNEHKAKKAPKAEKKKK